MSALPSKADICRRIEHVCFVPETDIAIEPRRTSSGKSSDTTLVASLLSSSGRKIAQTHDLQNFLLSILR